MKRVFETLTFILVSIYLFLPLQTLALNQQQRSEIEKRFWYDQTDCGSSTSTSTPASGGFEDKLLRAIMTVESGGDPTAQNPDSSASGKYQYIDRTWNSVKQAYPPAIPFAHAKEAPEAMQDAVAYIEYATKIRTLGEDVFKLAVSHYEPANINNPNAADIAYANSVVAAFNAGQGAQIPLLYNDAPDFARYLQASGGGAPTTPTATPNTTDSDTCDKAGPTVNTGVVDVAKRELAAWNGGAQDPSKFGGGSNPWCAFFISYIFKEAGQPLNKGGGDGVIGSAQGILDYAIQNGFYHPKGEQGFKPQPGDVAIYKEGISPYPSHVNLVISYDGVSIYTSIGGNESDQIKQSTHSINAPYLTGFMRVQ